MIAYLSRVFIALSIFLNAICGGKTNQTLSATQYARKRLGKWHLCPVIDRIFFWDDDHCREAWVKWTIIHRAIRHYEDLGKKYFEKKG